MLNEIRFISIFFTFILFLTFWTFESFFNNVISNQANHTTWLTIHIISLFTWVIFLFIQPILITYKKIKLHRKIGNISKIVVFLIVISTIIICFDNFFHSNESFSLGKKSSILFSQIVGLSLFLTMYRLALKHSKYIIYHVYFIIGSTLIILGPVIFRNVFTSQLNLVHTVEFTANLLTYSIINITFAIICIRLLKAKFSIKPFIISMIILIPVEICQIWFSI